MLARSVGDALQASADGDTHEILHNVLADMFWSTSITCSTDKRGALISFGEEAIRDRGVTDIHAGIILLTKEDNGAGLAVRELVSVPLTFSVKFDGFTARLWCAFTTESMAFAYASSRHPTPKVFSILYNTGSRMPYHHFAGSDCSQAGRFISRQRSEPADIHHGVAFVNNNVCTDRYSDNN
jgi:hypothetical protein